jgi:hypothetical protein
MPLRARDAGPRVWRIDSLSWLRLFERTIIWAESKLRAIGLSEHSDHEVRMQQS